MNAEEAIPDPGPIALFEQLLVELRGREGELLGALTDGDRRAIDLDRLRRRSLHRGRRDRAGVGLREDGGIGLRLLGAGERAAHESDEEQVTL
jgi:hypothetical protein